MFTTLGARISMTLILFECIQGPCISIGNTSQCFQQYDINFYNYILIEPVHNCFKKNLCYVMLLIFNFREDDSRLYHSISCYTIKKRKEEHSSNQMVSSFSFATLARARATQVKCILKITKDILTNCSQISLISSKIHVTSKKHILSERTIYFGNSKSSNRRHTNLCSFHTKKIS